MTSELNSLASSSGLTAGKISSSYQQNNQGGGLGGYEQGIFELYLSSMLGPATAGSGAYVWFINEVDGTDYEDGGTSVIPARKPDLIFPLRAVSTVQRIDVVAPLPLNMWYCLMAQNSGQNFASITNTLKVLPFTNQVV